MIRNAIIVLLAVHAAIHWIGFARSFGLTHAAPAVAERLVEPRRTLSKPVGLLWLAALGLLMTAAAFMLLRAERWYLFAGAGVLLSQLLIIQALPETRPGTLPNTLLALAVVLGFTNARFERQSDEAVRALFARVPATATPITPGDLAPLPAPVRRWLEHSGVLGKPPVRTVRLRQRGQLRTSPDQTFMAADAEQYFTVAEPGFIWRVRTRMAHVLPVVGRDTLVDGMGSMRIEAAAFVPLVTATGPEVDQGALLRYLGEVVWFPTAALSPSVRWEPIDEQSARAFLSSRGKTVSAVFTFDAQGRFLHMSAQRYLGVGAHAKLTRWFVPARAWRTMNGVVVPVQGDVVWQLAGGDFNYFKWEITDIEYDRPALYDD